MNASRGRLRATHESGAASSQLVAGRLHPAGTRILNLPDIRERLVSGGYTIVASAPEPFGEKVQRDVATYREIILESGMQLND